jgi:NAD(P)-dependent dehydrogenase (short-subunit alcohol dehydrogenase family)
MNFDFSGKVAVVTGAAGNVGQVVARAFLDCGASVALVDRREGRLRPLFDDHVDSSRCHFAEGVDNNSLAAMQAMASGVVERFDRLDFLVHTIGGFAGGQPLHQTSLDTYKRMMDSHPGTTFIACQAVIPHMLEQASGKIVTMASRSAYSGPAGQSAYAAAKAAVLRLTESLSAEVKTKGINVNCIVPSTIDTEENRQNMPKADHSRWVQPESLADVILFLCSDLARDIHGAAIPVYGLS